VAIPIVDVAGYYQRLVIELDNENDNDENRHLNDNNEKQKDQKENQQKNQQYAASSGAECNFPIPSHYWEDYTQMKVLTTYPAQIMNEVMRSNSFTSGISYHGTQESLR